MSETSPGSHRGAQSEWDRSNFTDRYVPAHALPGRHDQAVHHDSGHVAKHRPGGEGFPGQFEQENHHEAARILEEMLTGGQQLREHLITQIAGDPGASPEAKQQYHDLSWQLEFHEDDVMGDGLAFRDGQLFQVGYYQQDGHDMVNVRRYMPDTRDGHGVVVSVAVSGEAASVDNLANMLRQSTPPTGRPINSQETVTIGNALLRDKDYLTQLAEMRPELLQVTLSEPSPG